MTYHPDTAALRAGCEELVRHGIRLLDDGLAIGTAGNLSLRLGDTVLITPSGAGYRDLTPDDICPVTLTPGSLATGSLTTAADRPLATGSLATAADGTLDADPVPAEASSELPLHLAVYGATDAAAIVHTHSPEAVALSAVRDDLPAIHYAISTLGGPVRVAGYERFGSRHLARAALDALDGRQAVILRNHGAVTYGPACPRPTTAPCCWSGWPASTGWPARSAPPASSPPTTWPKSVPRCADAITASPDEHSSTDPPPPDPCRIKISRIPHGAPPPPFAPSPAGVGP